MPSQSWRTSPNPSKEAVDGEADKIRCAWSNEAFELWYLLHFEYRNTGMTRTEYEYRLTEHLGSPYQKNAEDMFERLENLGDRGLASGRAEQLRGHYDTATPYHAQNPCTKVDKLVGRLLRFRNP